MANDWKTKNNFLQWNPCFGGTLEQDSTSAHQLQEITSKSDPNTVYPCRG